MRDLCHKLEPRLNEGTRVCFSPTNVKLPPLRWTIFAIVLLLTILPKQYQQQQIGQVRNSFATSTNQQQQTSTAEQNRLLSTREQPILRTNTSMLASSRDVKPNKRNQLQITNNTSRSAKEPTVRIATLDDLSQRLDQSRDTTPLEQDDTRVPFWNIAHMINSIEQVDLAIGSGSNGIETDISFDTTGHPNYAYHGLPCDCGRHCFHQEDLVKFVQYLAQITVPPASSRLLLVLFDLKLKDLKEPHQKETAGRHLAELLHKYLYAPYQSAASYHSRKGPVQPPLRVVVSINHANDILVAKSFINYMHSNRLSFMSQHVGFDVGMNDNLTEISAAWDGLRGATFNIWQGDGLTNCVNLVRNVERLKQAISIRNNQGHFRKVYFWTADIMYHIRSVLRLGLDAMLTNKPQRVNQVLNETEFRSKYRLATPYDDPFQQFHIRPSSWGFVPPSVGEIVETITNIRETSSNFIKTLPEGLSAAINKVNQSIGLPSRS